MSMFGAVVVGVGIAGSVRIRDLVALQPGDLAARLAIKGFISRRNLENQQGVNQITTTEALRRDDVHVAFICTENEYHEDSIRQFLQAGKHVCVEYPMTLSYKAAVELWDFAHKKGLILHEEHIELLTSEYKELKKAVEGKTLQGGTLRFSGAPLRRGISFPSFSGIARLHWLIDLFGELSVTAATLQEHSSENYSKMTAQLVTATNRPLTWIEERGRDLPRAKNINFQFDSCCLTELPAPQRGSVGPFMQDLMLFSAKLGGQLSEEELLKEKRRIMHSLELAEKIQQACQSE